jgi:hypothetical protein
MRAVPKVPLVDTREGPRMTEPRRPQTSAYKRDDTELASSLTDPDPRQPVVCELSRGPVLLPLYVHN